MPVHTDASFIDIIKTHQKLYHRCLSCAGRAYDRHHLAGRYPAAEIVDNDLIFLIAEFHMFKADCPFDLIQPDRMGDFYILFFLIQKFKHSLRRGRHGLQHIGDLGHLNDRLGKILYILYKCLDIPHFDRSFDRQEAAAYRYRHISKISDKHHNRMHHSR